MFRRYSTMDGLLPIRWHNCWTWVKRAVSITRDAALCRNDWVNCTSFKTARFYTKTSTSNVVPHPLLIWAVAAKSVSITVGSSRKMERSMRQNIKLLVYNIDLGIITTNNEAQSDLLEPGVDFVTLSNLTCWISAPFPGFPHQAWYILKRYAGTNRPK